MRDRAFSEQQGLAGEVVGFELKDRWELNEELTTIRQMKLDLCDVQFRLLRWPPGAWPCLGRQDVQNQYDQQRCDEQKERISAEYPTGATCARQYLEDEG